MFENLFSVGGLSIERLRSFVEVVQAGSIARVAQGDLSRQSLISRQIGDLEAFFGVELTTRRGKGLEFTEAGQELARQVRLQFQGFSDFKAASLAQPREYRIASGNSVLEWLVAPHMGALAERVPGLFFLSDRRTSDTVRGLLDHTVDFGIIRRKACVRPLRFHSLGYLTYRLFVPTVEAVNSDALPLAMPAGGEFSEAFVAASKKSRALPKIGFRCSSYTQAAQMVRSGVACAFLPHTAAPYLGDSVVVRNPAWLQGIRFELGLAWHGRMLDVRPGSVPLKEELIRVLANKLTRMKSL